MKPKAAPFPARTTVSMATGTVPPQTTVAGPCRAGRRSEKQAAVLVTCFVSLTPNDSVCLRNEKFSCVTGGLVAVSARHLEPGVQLPTWGHGSLLS